MLSEGERAEHRALSERAYGRGVDRPLSAEEADRLRELEDRRAAARRPGAAPPPAPAAAHPAPAADSTDAREREAAPSALPGRGSDAATAAEAEHPPSPDPAASAAASAAKPRTARRWLLPVVAAVCLAVGGAAGWAVGHEPPPESGASGPPELARPATDEDAMNASGLLIDPGSTRFVARIDGVDVFLARAVDPGASVCLVTVSPATGPSAGCGEWSPTTGGISVGLSDDVTVAIGPVAPGRAPGSAFALSETVYAIRSE
ncbi:hypothetical protein [Microbacterium sp. 10M-3C3]|jgi:hypothetical protein|uniref:hypothetical protein n=1 Tax=Microbacterium sp. 10M-3C3 TaxID=2483401 RepID=UPI000F631F87|nr:hypothetical protein [Microbacterium sp. 10M-3C3]